MTTTTTTTTILPRTTPLVVFSRHHHRAVEVDARSGIFACQTTRSSVTGTRTWKKTPSLLLMLLFGIALRRSFFLSSVSRNFSFVFFFFSIVRSSMKIPLCLSLSLVPQTSKFLVPFSFIFCVCFLPRPPRRARFSFPQAGHKFAKFFANKIIW